MNPSKRLERRNIILGQSQVIEDIQSIKETINLKKGTDTLTLTFLDKKKIKFSVISEDNGETLVDLISSDIKKYTEGLYVIKTEDIKNDSSIEIFQIVEDEKVSMGNTKKIIDIEK